MRHPIHHKMSNRRAEQPCTGHYVHCTQDNPRPLVRRALACVAVVFMVAGCGGTKSSPPVSMSEVTSQPVPAPLKAETKVVEAKPVADAKPVAETKPAPVAPDPPAAGAEPMLVDDDGKSLWNSPTHGKPLNLGWLSPGAQIIAVLRPAALVKHPEGEKILAALGPDGKLGVEYIEKSTTLLISEIEQLIIGAQTASDGKWSLTFVAHVSNPISSEGLKTKLTGAIEAGHAGNTYLVAND